MAQLHGLSGAGVGQRHIRRDLAGDHLEVGIAAILVGGGLKYKRIGVAVLGQIDLHRLAVRVGTLAVGDLHRVGEQLHTRIQHGLGADAGKGAAAHDRAEDQIPHAGVESFQQFLLSEGLAVEELLHLFLAGLGHRLAQLLIEVFHHLHFVGGDGNLLPASVWLELIGLLVDDIDQRADLLVTVPHGHHGGADGPAELLPQGFPRAVEIAALLVGLGNIDGPGHVPLLQILPCLFGAHGNAALCGTDDDAGIRHAEGLQHLSGKIKISRSVDHVDLHALELDGSNAQGDGNFPLDLLRIIIAGGISIGHFTETIRAAGQIQHRLHQRGLAVSAVAK